MFAYGFASTPTTIVYTPPSHSQFNSTGGTNTLQRTGVGTYTITFPGLGVPGGIVAVTPASTAYRCKVASWNQSGTDEKVNVRCFNQGALADMSFGVSFQRPAPGDGPRAYVFADDGFSTGYTPAPAFQFNSTGATNTAARNDTTGYYVITLPGLGAPGGHVQVTSYGTASDHCKVVDWTQSGANEVVRVGCYAADGSPAFARFTMTYVNATRFLAGTTGTHAYLLNTTATPNATYTPSPAYLHNSTGQSANVTRQVVGQYSVAFVGTGPSNGGLVHVTAHGSGAAECSTGGVAPSGEDVIIYVRCATPSGTFVDSQFTVSWTD
jgi:hypothetical protein